jgi:chlorobactene glucosyltransferase
LLVSIAVAGWCALALLGLLSLRRLRAECVPEPGPDEGRDSLSVILAAHDEEPRVGACVATLLAQDHPDFEVVVVDDRSSDGTARAVREAASGDPRVRLLRVDKRPEGWQGRLWAQGVGAEAARNEWILFLSADQRLRGTTFLRAMVARYRLGGEAAVSVVGPFGARHWWDRVWLQPIANNPLLWGTLFLVQEQLPRAIWLVGALGMRRSTYRDLGGVRAAALCGSGAFDDMGWAKLVAQRGLRGRMVYHAALEDVSNWESFPEFWQGVTRWAAGVFTYRRAGWFVAGLCASAIALSLAGTVASLGALLEGRMPAATALVLAAMLPTVGVFHCRWNRRSLGFALAFWPVGVEVLMMLGGGAWARWRNRVFWRGEVVKVLSPPP